MLGIYMSQRVPGGPQESMLVEEHWAAHPSDGSDFVRSVRIDGYRITWGSGMAVTIERGREDTVQAYLDDWNARKLESDSPGAV